MDEYTENKYAIISIIGPHAGECEEEIFARKIMDSKKFGRTFWLVRSWQDKPDIVQAFCTQAQNEDQKVHCIFIEPSSRGGATPTKTSTLAKQYSKDNVNWLELPNGLSSVTGKIDGSAYALVFDNLDLQETLLDLWNYASSETTSEPVKIRQGASTICAIKKDMSAIPETNKIKSRYRRIVAVGRLCDPYGVWLR